jgi:hypothetical protein
MWGILQMPHPWREGLEAYLDDRMRWPRQSSSSAGRWSEWTSAEHTKQMKMGMSIYSDMMGYG